MRLALRQFFTCALLAALTAAPVALAADDAVVLVVGASGETGLEMLAAARTAGLQPRGMTRNRARAAREHPDFSWVEADARKPAQLATAMHDAQYVLCTIGAPALNGPDAPQFVDYLGVVNTVDAAVAAGVSHFVLISSGAAGPHREPRQTPRLAYVLLWKTLAENHLKASGLNYTIIGPGGLYGTPARQQGLVAIARSDYRAANVSRGDVARVAVDALRNPQAIGKSFALFNSETAAPETWRQQLAALPMDAADHTAIESLAWLTGHWTYAREGATNEELWLPADAGLMLGVNRSITAAGKRSFEQLRIEERAAGVFLIAAPGGEDPTEFKLTSSAPRRALFENPEHDFPQRIHYERVDDTLRARVEGSADGKPLSQSWTWRLQQSLRAPYLAPDLP
ncbi:MAG TPA: DUF6265 family protein [Steroidobacteraceae bacterium]|nr:DUF6265 family protein [Steroidobacteraceae bacterium]HRX91004.1 DUF6265 family protein [Steroidobacteraceae bacterium]